jgi:APA family basic amino acid/polyamine antiporter
MSFFATKPVDVLIAEAQETGEHTLKRALSGVDLIFLGIGAIIGTGIFVLTGQAAAKHAGPAVVISMILAGFVSALAAFCYSEFASAVPISGSAYAYGYATLGEFVAWLIGWDLILEYVFGAATVAVGWSGYVVSFLKEFGIEFPVALRAAPGTLFVQLPENIVTQLNALKTISVEVGWNTVNPSLVKELSNLGYSLDALPTAKSVFNLPSFLIAVFVTALLVKGIKESANFNTAIVIVKTSVVILFILAGISFVNMDNLVPFIPEQKVNELTGQPEFGVFGWSGILTGAAIIFFAYIGFDAVSTAAQEAKNPAKDMPIGIIGSLLICTILYVLVAFVMVGVVSYTQLNVPAPIAEAINAARVRAQGTVFESILSAMPFIIKLGAVLGLASTMVVMVLGQPRIFYSMSKDGLLPTWAAKVHPRFRTPYITTIIAGSSVALIAGFVRIDILGELVSIGTLFAFVIVSLGVIIMRYTHPDLPRPFKVPLSPYFPIISALASAYLMNGLPLDTWMRLILWMSVGLVIYFAYGYRNSRLPLLSENSSNGVIEGKVPLSPILGVILLIALTIWQFGIFSQVSPMQRFVETVIRLFLWLMLGVMIYFMTYGRKFVVAQTRSRKIATYGLIASLVNLGIWLIVAYWFWTHYAEIHGTGR